MAAMQNAANIPLSIDISGSFGRHWAVHGRTWNASARLLVRNPTRRALSYRKRFLLNVRNGARRRARLACDLRRTREVAQALQRLELLGEGGLQRISMG